MVARILRLEEAPRPADAADALALAICHVWRGGTTARLDAAMEAAAARSARQRQAFRQASAVIASVSGPVLQVGPTSAVIEVGGLGILALCSPNTVAGLRVGERTTLATALIVREDSLTLYGFASADEREFFELLLTATGVGPKLAQAALAVLTPGRAARRDRRGEPGPALQGARHRPQGRAADRDRAQGQDQRRRAARRA